MNIVEMVKLVHGLSDREVNRLAGVVAVEQMRRERDGLRRLQAALDAASVGEEVRKAV